MRELPASAVFTSDQARSLGWTDAALSRAARSGRIHRLRRGVYSAAAPDPVAAAVAAAVAAPGVVVSHGSALLLYGLPVVGARPAGSEVTAAPGSTGRVRHAQVCRAALPPEHIAAFGGVCAVTTVARTLVDVGRRRSTACAVAALDAALHRRMVTAVEIVAVIRQCARWPGIARARRALALADGRSESPLESVSRLVIGWLRLPKPEPQVLVMRTDGVVVARTDFYWDEFGVVGEADGRAKYSAREVLTKEKERQEAMEDLNLTTARWGWDLVTRRPGELRTKLRNAFERGAVRDRAGVPRLWTAVETPPVGSG